MQNFHKYEAQDILQFLFNCHLSEKL